MRGQLNVTNTDEYESGLNIAGSLSIQKYTNDTGQQVTSWPNTLIFPPYHLATTLFQADQAVQFFYMSITEVWCQCLKPTNSTTTYDDATIVVKYITYS